MTPYQHSALGQYLSYWNEKLTYDEIIESLENNTFNDDEENAIWEPFQNDEGSHIANLIESFRERLEEDFVAKDENKYHKKVTQLIEALEDAVPAELYAALKATMPVTNLKSLKIIIDDILESKTC
jgi:hypothetical protein